MAAGRRVRGYAQVAARALEAANAQQVRLPGQDVRRSPGGRAGHRHPGPRRPLKHLEPQIAAAFRHPHASAIESMPGFGPILGAMLLVAAGDLRGYPDAGHLAAAAGLVPVPKDSGRRVGNVHKPRRYSRPLRHALYLSALTSYARRDRTATTTRRNAPPAGPTNKP